MLLALARHVAARGRAGGPRAAVHRRRGASRWPARARSTPSRLRSGFGFVFDHASPIGEVIDRLAQPLPHRGVAFAAPPRTPGIRPEDGRSAILAAARAIAAMPLGRLDEQHDGQRRHDLRRHRHERRPRGLHARGRGRARSTTQRAEELVAEIVDRLHEAANLPDCDCDVDVSVAAHLLRLPPAARREPPVRVAEAGAARLRARARADLQRRRLGRQRADRAGLRRRSTSPTAPSAPTSRASASARVALEEMLDVALALLDEAAAARARRGPVACAADAEAPPRHRRRDRRRRRRVEQTGRARLMAASSALVVELDRRPLEARRRAGDRRRRRSSGAAEVGDEVIVNVQALDLGLGSGGFDVVHVNLTRGLTGEGDARARDVMKLNYTSLQHAVAPVEDEPLRAARGAPGGGARPARPAGRARVGVRPERARGEARLCPDRGRRAARRALAHRARAARARAARRPPDRRARPSAARERRSAPPARCTTACARSAGTRPCAGPGPGIVGSGSPLGHGGMVGAGLRARGARARLPDAAGRAHVLRRRARRATAASPTTPSPSSTCCSSRSPWRCRRGCARRWAPTCAPSSAPCSARCRAGPQGEPARRSPSSGASSARRGITRHDWRRASVDLPGYAASGLPTETMGRGLAEDPLFFAAALAGGSALAELARASPASGQLEIEDALGEPRVSERLRGARRRDRLPRAHRRRAHRALPPRRRGRRSRARSSATSGAVGMRRPRRAARVARAPAPRGGRRARRCWRSPPDGST